ncbi:Oidioi.mRNA.OKI2018_I69.chr1.g1912.t3.cds [Oikopleura dioica]|uniref:Zinc transporter ZIP11 n=1 Tax=Oikopleura dioica TaxID=34765 RepID=A0ABN7SPF0_OIKDI|nr:Oidioi.mRNA.OKI2018_I69.chr1.g1912.t3.cds [Oikopleura dioica]
MIESASPIVQATLGTLFTWGVTALGSALVFCLPGASRIVFDIALGFSAGVMLAASYWSLLAPAIELSEGYGNFAIVPSLVGFLLGGAFVYLSDRFLPQDTVKILISKADGSDSGSFSSQSDLPLSGELQSEEGTQIQTRARKRNVQTNKPEKDGADSRAPLTNKSIEQRENERQDRTKRIALLILAITIHNIPEGLAVGVGFATDNFQNARNLAIGIGIQNFPEGLAVSLPLRAQGMSPWKAFFWGQLSGMFEPIAGILGCLISLQATYILPYALAFAAGAMVFVVMDDIIPEVQTRGNHRAASWAVMIGFCVMMTLDVTLG